MILRVRYLLMYSFNVSLPYFNVDCMIDFILPTGAMGNITGGYMAKQMGVPIGRLCAAVNTNGEM